MVSLHAMYKYNVPAQIAAGEEIPLGEIARRCSVENDDALGRLLQHAVTNRLLAQPRPGHIAHSAISAMLAGSPPLMDWVGSSCEDIWPAAPRVVEALTRWPGQDQALPIHTGHNLAEGTSVSYFETMARRPERAKRFASAMSIMQTMPGWEPSAALNAYDWGALEKGATIVDVGGSNGAFAALLTERYPSLSVAVQDQPDVIKTAALPAHAMDKVTLQAHDFFEPQPVEGADVYFLRMILHDWPDHLAMKILRQLIPALKPGARIIINDHCIPPPGSTSRREEWQSR